MILPSTRVEGFLVARGFLDARRGSAVEAASICFRAGLDAAEIKKLRLKIYHERNVTNTSPRSPRSPRLPDAPRVARSWSPRTKRGLAQIERTKAKAAEIQAREGLEPKPKAAPSPGKVWHGQNSGHDYLGVLDDLPGYALK